MIRVRRAVVVLGDQCAPARPSTNSRWRGRPSAPAHGVFVHPKYNWFMLTALSEADVDSVLVATDAAFGEVAKRYSLSEL